MAARWQLIRGALAARGNHLARPAGAPGRSMASEITRRRARNVFLEIAGGKFRGHGPLRRQIGVRQLMACHAFRRAEGSAAALQNLGSKNLENVAAP